MLNDNQIINISNYNATNNNNVRTIYASMDTSESGEKCIEKQMGSNNSKTLDTNYIIYRYKFSEQFQEELYEFAKIHEYDDRHSFKEAWELWKDQNKDIISIEIRRLNNLGYDGDCLDKMFKSVRYYFRKKSTIKKEQKKRSIYIKINKEFLELMDNHIEKHSKPSIGFSDFYEKYRNIINKQFESLSSLIELDDFEKKIKKTYKNRYFLHMNKI